LALPALPGHLDLMAKSEILGPTVSLREAAPGVYPVGKDYLVCPERTRSVPPAILAFPEGTANQVKKAIPVIPD